MMVAVATTLWGVNGVISKVVLNNDIEPSELTECRMLGAFAGMAAVLLLTQPDTLRVTRREWPELIALGLIGLVGVQLLYLVALQTLPVGITVLIEYLAPLLVALYAWLWLGRRVGRGRVVVAGTLVPFALLVSALHAVSATRVTLLSTWEPVSGGLIAWVWLGQSLTATQLAAAGLVPAGILTAETPVGGEPHA